MVIMLLSSGPEPELGPEAIAVVRREGSIVV